MFLKRKRDGEDAENKDDIIIYSQNVRESLLDDDELTPQKKHL